MGSGLWAWIRCIFAPLIRCPCMLYKLTAIYRYGDHVGRFRRADREFARRVAVCGSVIEPEPNGVRAFTPPGESGARGIVSDCSGSS